jgi:epoxyqueuosine reductase
MVKEVARNKGFDLVGVAPAQSPEHWDFYQKWLDLGYAGEMGYLGRNLNRRADPCEILPNARSILCLGTNYLPSKKPEVSTGARGSVSKYAQGDDYHDVIEAQLADLLAEIQKLVPSAEGRYYVDTGPVLERDVAARAGLGWFGKHTVLIHKRKGSWFFLSEIILNLDLEPDVPQLDHCGTCTRCIDACPTDAIVAPYEVDSRRCISYLTIELRGSIPRQLRKGMGQWVYGCDICQDVCPWNEKHAQPTQALAFQSRSGLDAPKLVDLLKMDQSAFSAKFKGSPIKRAKRRGLLRNVAVALGNVGSEEDIPALEQALCDLEPLVRLHTAWALGQIGGDRALAILKAAEQSETEKEVLEEILLAIETIQNLKGLIAK